MFLRLLRIHIVPLIGDCKYDMLKTDSAVIDRRIVLYMLSSKENGFDYWSLMAIRDEGQGWDRFCDDQVGLFASGDGTVCVANSHCICRIDGAGIE